MTATREPSYHPETGKNLLEAARHHARDARETKQRLVDIRRVRDLTQDEIAARIGWSPAKTRKFEAYWSNPTQDDIYAYALGVGARITTNVEMETR